MERGKPGLPQYKERKKEMEKVKRMEKGRREKGKEEKKTERSY